MPGFMGGSASRLEIDRASFRRISIRVLTKSGRATANQLAVRLQTRIVESQEANMVRIESNTMRTTGRSNSYARDGGMATLS